MRGKFVNEMIAVFGMLWLGCGTVLAADLQLNPDTLIRIRNEPYGSYIKAEEAFWGVNDEKFTLDDVENCIKKYGLDYVPYYSEKNSQFEFNLPVISINVCFFEEVPDGYENTLEYSWIYENASSESEMIELLRQIELDKNTIMEFFWDNTYPASGKDELIERISIINHGGYTLKEGWKWEENVWRYYENDKWIIGFKWIDNELYHFETDGSLSHNKFAVIDGRKFHFNGNWADRGWQMLEENGQTNWYYFDMSDAHALVGYQAGFEGDSYRYFFWQDGFTDQNGKAYPEGALACGSADADLWVYQNGNPVYVADKDGHLYVNTQKNWNGTDYSIDAHGNTVAAFMPREVAPEYSNPYYYTNMNEMLSFKTCTWYAWGRAYEILEKRPDKLSKQGAGRWYDESTYEKGSTPRLGAIACWGYPGADGHVAVVEKIDGNVVTVSEAGTSTDFNISEMYADGRYKSGWNNSGRYDFRGYLYIN